MDDRQQIAAPPPTGVGLSDFIESGKDLEGTSPRWRVSPAKSRIFARGSSQSESPNRPSVFVVLRPPGQNSTDNLITIEKHKDGSKTASVNILPPMDVLDKLVREQLGHTDRDANVKQLGQQPKELLSLGDSRKKTSVISMPSSAQNVVDTFIRGKLHNDVSGARVFNLEPLVNWIVSHEDEFVPLSEGEISKLTSSDTSEEEDGSKSTEPVSETLGERLVLSEPPCPGTECTKEQVLTEFVEFASTIQEPRLRQPNLPSKEKMIYEQDDISMLSPVSKNGPIINASNLLVAMRRESLLAKEVE